MFNLFNRHKTFKLHINSDGQFRGRYDDYDNFTIVVNSWLITRKFLGKTLEISTKPISEDFLTLKNDTDIDVSYIDNGGNRLSFCGGGIHYFFKRTPKRIYFKIAA